MVLPDPSYPRLQAVDSGWLRTPVASFYSGDGVRPGTAWTLAVVSLAERAGFEPALGYYPKHAFQACDLNRSSTSPVARFYLSDRLLLARALGAPCHGWVVSSLQGCIHLRA